MSIIPDERTRRRLPDLDGGPRPAVAYRAPALISSAPLDALIRHRDECAAEVTARWANVDVAYALARGVAAAESAYWASYARWVEACEAVARATPRVAAADEMPTCADPLTRGATR